MTMELKPLRDVQHGLGGLCYQSLEAVFAASHARVHTVTYDQRDPTLKLVLSKASEALNPGQPDNHTGEGGTLAQLVASQPDLRFFVNGTYSHYRKGYYSWHHDSYEVGDPVGLVRIRDRHYDDQGFDTASGYLQRDDAKRWHLAAEPDMAAKYILSSRPLLISAGEALALPVDEIVEEGSVNPPSFLGHSMEHHARTAVGITPDGSLVFIVIEYAHDGEGATLPELQAVGMQLGLETMLNLDGGGSARFWLRTDEGEVLQNATLPEDAERILGHGLMLFSR